MTEQNNIINTNTNTNTNINTNDNNTDYTQVINRVNKLPVELKNEIFDFLPNEKLIFTNKEYYEAYHPLVYNLIPKRFTENYIRDMVARDNAFVFNYILREKYHKWEKIKDYVFKNVVYPNYLQFILSYCIMNESTKCKNVYYDYLKEQGITENQHKKNVVKHIRWRKLN